MTNEHTKVRWSLPRGRLLRRALRADPGSEYLVYIPTIGAVDTPVLVSVHGISRSSWHKQAEALVPGCERHSVTLLAPSFNGKQHSDYQRLGRKGRGQRADLFLHRCLQELNTMTGADTTQPRLFGHSGGAQFVHRYMMAYPHRIESAIVSAAGWYTFPDPAQKFPYGIRANANLSGVVFNPEAYLEVPVMVLVGTEDTKFKDLIRTDRINNQQGLTRIERARNWVAAMQAQAKAHGMPSHVSIVELASTGHSLTDLRSEIARIESVIFEFMGSVVHYNRFDDSLDAPTRSLN